MTELEQLAVKVIEALAKEPQARTKEDFLTIYWWEKASTPEAYLTLIQEKREMEEVLKSFAIRYGRWKKDFPFDAEDTREIMVKVTDLRRAARALTKGATP